MADTFAMGDEVRAVFGGPGPDDGRIHGEPLRGRRGELPPLPTDPGEPLIGGQAADHPAHAGPELADVAASVEEQNGRAYLEWLLSHSKSAPG